MMRRLRLRRRRCWIGSLGGEVRYGRGMVGALFMTNECLGLVARYGREY